MGREVKNFNWFEERKDKVWFGYLIGTAHRCELCWDNDNNCSLCYVVGYINMTIDPPEGEGWQMWEDCTEGKPISPVFKTKEKLAKWLADTGASAMGHQTATCEQWLNMIKVGSVCSAVMVGGEFKTGVAASGDK